MKLGLFSPHVLLRLISAAASACSSAWPRGEGGASGASATAVMVFARRMRFSFPLKLGLFSPHVLLRLISAAASACSSAWPRGEGAASGASATAVMRRIILFTDLSRTQSQPRSIPKVTPPIEAGCRLPENLSR